MNDSPKTPPVDFGELVGVARSAPAGSARARKASYLGAIVAAAGVAPPGKEVPTLVACRRRPGNRPCRTPLLVHRQQVPSLVCWRCPACGDGGRIGAWAATPWNLGPDLPRSEPGETRTPVFLSAQDLDVLVRELMAHRPSMALLHLARPCPTGGYDVELTGDQLALLVRVAAEAGDRDLPHRRDVALFLAIQPLVDALEDEEELRSEHDATGVDGEDSFEPLLLFPAERGASASSDAAPPELTVHRLRVQLMDVRPAVWRRVEVSSDLSLAELNEVLQETMGWRRAHPYRYRSDAGRVVEDPARVGSAEGSVESADRVLLRDFAPLPGERLVYLYDLADGWQHEVRVEALRPGKLETPRILSGRGACPPEDLGGPIGYAEALAVLTSPEPDLRELSALLERGFEDFDPEAFDLAQVQRGLESLGTPQG